MMKAKLVWRLLIWKKTKKCPYGENSIVGTECCLSKIEKLAIPARVKHQYFGQ